jgi:hypothetical protein
MSTPAPKLPEFVRRIVDELYACGVGCAPALCDNGPGCVCPCHGVARALDLLSRIHAEIGPGTEKPLEAWSKLKSLLKWARSEVGG